MHKESKDQIYLNNFYQNRDNTVVPFQVEELDIRGRVVQLGESLNSILTRHQYPDPVSHLLAEALVITVLLGTSLKFEGKIILQTHSDGPVNMLVCDFVPPSNLRGYARFNKEKLQAITNGQTSSEILLGKGTLAFTIDQGPYIQSYKGIVALDGSNFQEASRTYFNQSEQIPTDLRLAVSMLINRDRKGKIQKSWRAGGFLIQLLPQASPNLDAPYQKNTKSEKIKTRIQLENQWQEAKALTATIDSAELTDPQVSTERLLFRLFHEQGVKVFQTFSIIDHCSCSREKIKDILKSFSVEKRTQTIENQQTSVTCEFCSTIYHFKPEELFEIKA
ncbi:MULTISPECIES: Hsp33 family molecular chaperone [unclassified Bartonella]|uniref:Hsp33 family molecular chaperone n=1 Tax=unclassified Bartonella TaxID=2645622 RepID=UPI00099A18C0|nr:MULTISPECIES: Hsp33 family molecular chaperone [unclassified Bartonella]AQX28694.1 molecular chaperone Hsp33 [Bartonella sp. JB15]AQX29948.1 molecular chaperone Hsp33 [Bartonella sp. JB63]